MSKITHEQARQHLENKIEDIDLKMTIDVNKVKTFVLVKDDENYVVDIDKLIQLGIVKKEKYKES